MYMMGLCRNKTCLVHDCVGRVNLIAYSQEYFSFIFVFLSPLFFEDLAEELREEKIKAARCAGGRKLFLGSALDKNKGDSQ